MATDSQIKTNEIQLGNHLTHIIVTDFPLKPEWLSRLDWLYDRISGNFMARNHYHVKISILILFLLILSGAAIAQKDSIRTRYIGVSYFSEGGLYPGFTFNYEKKLMSNASFQLLLAGKAGAYFHYGNHTGVFAMVQSGQRFHLYKKLYFEHFLGIGYLQSFLSGGDAYYVNAAGQIQKAYNTGNPHFMPSVSFGISYHLDQAQRPMIFFFRPMIFWQIPFNDTSLVQYAFELGALVKLKK